MMDDTILINSNVAYVCRNNAEHRQVSRSKDCSSESVPIEVNNNEKHKAANQQSQRLTDLMVKVTKMKKLLVYVIVICAALIMITLTAIILSALSYGLSQIRNEHPIRLTKGNNTDTLCTCTTVPQDILQLHEYIQTRFDSLQIQLYCGAGQWHRIAFLNITDPSQQCPSAWREYKIGGIRACGRSTASTGSCANEYYFTSHQYSRVCGRVIGYQVASPDAFVRIHSDQIDFDGVNITRGAKRDHIWSYVAGVGESSTNFNCPCSTTNSSSSPSSIGKNYYCESGNPRNTFNNNQIFPNDPLWDGQQCENTCCTGTNSPPWFSVQLPAPTTDAIEVSICADESTDNEDTPIELLEIYVQ